MAEIDKSLSDEQKIVEYMAREQYDKLVEHQIQGLNTGEETVDAKPLDYEAIAKAELKEFTYNNTIQDYAESKGLSINPTAPVREIKKALISERVKQLKGEIPAPQGARTISQSLEVPTTSTSSEYEEIIGEEISGFTKDKLKSYAASHNLDLNVGSKATKGEIIDAITQERTKQLKNNPEEIPVGRSDESIHGMTKTQLKKYAARHGIVLNLGSRATVSEIAAAILQDRTQQIVNTPPSKTSTPLNHNWVYYMERTREELRDMPREDLIGYAERLHLKIPNIKSIKSLRQAIINQRADQLMQQTKGSGLKKRRIIVGRGYSDDEDKPVRKNTIPKKVINGKFIDLNKLKNNILTVRYLKTGGFLPNIKAQHISNDLKEVIQDLINEKFEKRLYEKLQPDEKRLVKRLVSSLKLNIDVNTKEDDEYRRQFEILVGEFRAGNNSDLVKNKLKQYVVESMQSGMITRREAWQLLYELTINN